jgi:integrase
MAKRGRKLAPGLRWHTTKGWYRLYDGRPKYFGGSGAREKSQIRKDDSTIKSQAEERWHRHESERLFGNSLSTMTRSAGKLKGFADGAKVIADHMDLGLLSEDQRNLLIERLRNAAVGLVNEIASQNQEPFGAIPKPTPTAAITGPTCRKVTDAYLAYLKAESERDPETKRAHYIDAKSRLKHWLDFIGRDTPISSLTKNDFLRYRDYWNNEAGKRTRWLKTQPQSLSFKDLVKGPGTSQATVNKHFVLVKGAFTAANREAGIVVPGIDDMIAVLRQSRVTRRELPLITPEHFKKMIDDLDEKWSLICLLAMNIAGSNADLARLKWTHIRNDGVFDWSRDKNIRIRRIPLWKRTIKALNAYRKTSQSETYVFTTSHGNSFQHSTTKSRKDQLGQIFSSKMDEWDLPYTFGAFRKSATTTALVGGANETVIKMLLGDAGNEVWRHYGMTVPGIVAEAVKSVEKHYFAAKKSTPRKSKKSKKAKKAKKTDL